MNKTEEFIIHYWWDNYEEIDEEFQDYLDDNDINYNACDDHNIWDDERVILYEVISDNMDEINEYFRKLLNKYHGRLYRHVS